MLKYLLLSLLLIVATTLAFCKGDDNSPRKHVEWQPVYGYKSDDIKLFVDSVGISRHTIKGEEITSGLILVVPSESREMTVKDLTDNQDTLPKGAPRESVEKFKTVSFRSVATFVSVNCKRQIMLTISNTYFDKEMPDVSDIPISTYVFVLKSENLINFPKDGFIFNTFCTTPV